MATGAPLVRFYDLTGPKPWSPGCLRIRFALNYKGIPYETVKIGYPAIRGKCEELFKDMTGLEATVPIVEILGENYKVINDSTPITKLLNERFPASAGFKDLKGLDKIDEYEKETAPAVVQIRNWILNDVYENALDKSDADGSREYFKRTREQRFGCALSEVLEVVGGGEAAVLEGLRQGWAPLRDRMKNDDGTGEPSYLDIYDASHFKWVEASSPEKAKRLIDLYGDDTFKKLLKKVEPYF